MRPTCESPGCSKEAVGSAEVPQVGLALLCAEHGPVGMTVTS